MIRRLLGGAAVLMAITVASKLIGFAREMILLERIGIGVELDVFLVLLGIANIVTGALGICVVTSVTPLARRFVGARGARMLMREGLEAGLWTWAAATLACLGYVAVAAAHATAGVWVLAMVVPSMVPFSLLAEYQVGLFLARGQRTPVISGNIIISLPLALALLVFDMNIIAYAVGLTLSFACRTAVFAWLLMMDGQPPSPGQADPPRVSLFGERLGRTLAGGSAILAMSVVYVTATAAARQFGEGQATLLGYGLKIPLFALTSVWFVLGTGFFADLVTHGARAARSQIARLTRLNIVLLVASAAVVLMVREFGAAIMPLFPGKSSAIVSVVEQSLPFLPLILFLPLVEMVQRVAVAEERHHIVPAISVAVLAVAALFQAVGVLAGSEMAVFLSPTAASAAGALAALVVLRRLRPPGAAVEARSTAVPHQLEDPFLP